MCGIFALLNNETFSYEFINNEFMKGDKRGPESSKLTVNTSMKVTLGFHRLAINGLNSLSDQPFEINDIMLICNGEIYNYKQLYDYMKVTPITGSDCEVIIHLYLKYGIEQTLVMLDGVYSFVLFDNRLTPNLNNKIYVARDPYGVRPLYKYSLQTGETQLFGFASDLKCLSEFYKNGITNRIENDRNNEQNEQNERNGRTENLCLIEQFQPGSYSSFNLSDKVNTKWIPDFENKIYFTPSFSYNTLINVSNSKYKNEDQTNDIFKEYCENISHYLRAAVVKRCNTTERPVACLLSGGLDSSLISALVADYFRSESKQIETYSIGLLGSEDLKYAKIVAEWIGSKHTEIIVSEKDMFDAIPEVIYAIESYDTTTVRASIGNYLIGKYISKNSEAKVIFNGDGSDELLGGYLYMNKCPDDIEFDGECRRLLKDIHSFDVLRSDKSISSNGLEPRTPFLDRNFVNNVLSIPPYFRNHRNFKECEKFLLRRSFSKDLYLDNMGRQIIPDEILYRKKEAFSDGVSSQGRSLFVILQEFISEYLNNELQELQESKQKLYKPEINTEKKYYKSIFEEKFGDCSKIIPYYWMPKYTIASDPSARTLNFYSEKEKQE